MGRTEIPGALMGTSSSRRQAAAEAQRPVEDDGRRGRGAGVGVEGQQLPGAVDAVDAELGELTLEEPVQRPLAVQVPLGLVVAEVGRRGAPRPVGARHEVDDVPVGVVVEDRPDLVVGRIAGGRVDLDPDGIAAGQADKRVGGSLEDRLVLEQLVDLAAGRFQVHAQVLDAGRCDSTSTRTSRLSRLVMLERLTVIGIALPVGDVIGSDARGIAADRDARWREIAEGGVVAGREGIGHELTVVGVVPGDRDLAAGDPRVVRQPALARCPPLADRDGRVQVGAGRTDGAARTLDLENHPR